MEDYDRQALERLLKGSTSNLEGCCIFNGNVNNHGYGQIYYKGKMWPAHRLSFYLLKKDLYKESLNVCHTCDNRQCINPEHLFIASQSENMLDSIAKGRHPKANQTHCIRGHEFTPENTRYRKEGRRVCRKCDALRQGIYQLLRK